MENVIIFGTGARAEKVIKSCEKDKYNIVAYLDNNEKAHGTKFHDILICSPEQLKSLSYDKILICSTAYNEIYKQLVDGYHIDPQKIKNHLYFLKCKLLDYYSDLSNCNPEINDIIEFLQTNDLQIFNYSFREKYKNLDIVVEYDENVNLYYVIYNGKRMYFKESFKTKRDVINYYRFLLEEQDAESPHRYQKDGIVVEEGDVVIDAGVAEGNFALDIIDKVSKIYLIETDDEWIYALKQTFKDYSHKVVFVNKFLTDSNDKNNITLDYLIGNDNINFLKMDIEGAEIKALMGAKETLNNSGNLKVNICAYHNNEDKDKIFELLKKHNFHVGTTNGYMFYVDDDTYEKTELRLMKGIVQGYK